MTDQQRAVAGALGMRLVRVLYRLALFPWLTVMQVGWIMASQVNWLLTGMTFQDVERASKSSRDIDRMMARLKN